MDYKETAKRLIELLGERKHDQRGSLCNKTAFSD